MTTPKILLVEDEPHIASGVIFNLEEEGYDVVHVESGEEALEALRKEAFFLVVLDLMLPGIDGLTVCRTLRQENPRLPVLMLTARSEEQDRIRGLSLGADDYLTKPFSLGEFLLRVKGMLRRFDWYRPELQDHAPYTFGENIVELARQRAKTPHGEITLTELEVKMLAVFFRKEGEILSRGEILKSVWGMTPDTETRTLDNFIVRLRKYFEADPTHPVFFQTVRGRGYRFIRNPAH